MSGLQMNYAPIRSRQGELVEAAESLGDVLKARACDAELNRRLSPETMADLFANGLLGYFVPARFGGSELDWGAQIHIGRALAHHCGSTAWIGGVVGSHALYIGRMDPRAQDDVWGAGANVLVSTGSVMRDVTVETLAGGYRLSGRWSFCSGVDHASWALLRASPSGDHRQSYFLIPRADFAIEDDWFVSSMSGSGSKSVLVKDVFIPDYRVLSMADMMAPSPPGAQANAHYLYSGSFRPFSGSNLMGPILGGAEAVLFEFERMMATGEGGVDASDVQWQLTYAEAAAEISAAEQLINLMIRTQTRYGSVGLPIPKAERIAVVRDRTYAARLCLNGATRLVTGLSADSVLKDAPIQRMFRDLQGMMQQIGVNWDRNMINCAKASLDMNTDIPELNAD
ncbi:3-hydroxy-9,10-secoandrosta-1,3,5(10)-triene-9,17-dione monooxygenase [Brevundimonas faecalis]|uniref:3-hydroxy-9,10-secoandrosta-1,3,5(10)-triene-9, 17-dione monooxygenase n=2 Tax=Brevundimonas faecalis TaxID=947378 RepID=A0ABV2RBH3_9CAUL